MVSQKTLKAQHEVFIQKQKENGKRITTYKCQHCKRDIETICPEESEVTTKGFWDTGKTCIECGAQNFVVTYPDGETKSKLIIPGEPLEQPDAE